MNNDKIDICFTKEDYDLTLGCINVTLDFLKNIPFKKKDIKEKILKIEDIKTKHFTC